MVLFARILLWLPHTQTGDMVDLPLRTPGERMAWSRLNGENAVCTADQCAAERCPLHIARRRAEQAHLVIVNHSLLLADVAAENHILPEFLDLIVDEAHHLESAVTNGLSFDADMRFLDTILKDITGERSGLLADVQRRLQAALPDHVRHQVDEFTGHMRPKRYKRRRAWRSSSPRLNSSCRITSARAPNSRSRFV